jgi:protein involved in polysaccharide export with SLBB domain
MTGLTARILMLVLLAIFSTSAPATAANLSSGDRVRVDVYGRADLSGEFEIRSSGKIALPLIGEIPAAGLTIPQLETSIAGELSRIERNPVVTISYSNLRPVFVLGYVRSPSAVPFRPGMTVLQAVSVSGGYGTGRLDSIDTQLEAIRARESRDALLVRRDTLLARKARLIAERERAGDLSLDTILRERMNVPAVGEIVETERLLLKSRAGQLASRQVNLERRRQIFDEEIAALRAQLEDLRQEKIVVLKERDIMTSLESQKLTSRPRATEAQRTVLRVQSEISGTTALLARAQASRAQVEQELNELYSGQLQGVLADISNVEQSLREVQEHLEAAREQIVVTGSALLGQAARDELAQAGSIILVRDGKRSRIDETSELRPGDVIDVPFPSTH